MCDLFQNVAEMEQSWISKRTRWAFQLEILPEAVNKGLQSYKSFKAITTTEKQIYNIL